MATSDEIKASLDKIAVNYETSPNEDGLTDSPNWHYSMLQLLGAIEHNLRIFNELYRIKNGFTSRDSNSS
ncbi:hypothetical protein KAR91_30085 [Candidatus Pacearchaeota archaeon]|nr:hypothetical protein [Candidatus Pacearchaeota archaeon]